MRWLIVALMAVVVLVTPTNTYACADGRRGPVTMSQANEPGGIRVLVTAASPILSINYIRLTGNATSVDPAIISGNTANFFVHTVANPWMVYFQINMYNACTPWNTFVGHG